MHVNSEAAPLLDQPTRSWHWQLTAAIVLALVGVAIYANAFSAPLIFDAKLFILENPAVREVWPWIFSLGGEHAPGANRPFGFLTFALNYAVGGHEVWGYHAVNLVIHVAAAWLLFDIVRHTLARGRLAVRFGAHAGGLALAVALLWLVHPLQTNAVTYVYQRLESLMTLCYLATLWCFLRALDSLTRGRWFAASVVCCALGMATKEVMVTAPLIVLWYDRVFAASSWREIVKQRGKYYAALAGAWGVLAWLMFNSRAAYAADGVLVVRGLSPLEYAQSQPGVILHYLRLAFWPDQLCLDYVWPVARTAAEIVPPALAIGTLVALTAWSTYRWPAVGFLGGCFFLILAPTSSVGPLKDLAFEHRMYLPLAAVIALVIVGGDAALPNLLARFRLEPLWDAVLRPVLKVSLVLAVVALAYLTVVRNRDYRSAQAIWQDTVRKRPENSRAHDNLANAIRQEHGDLAGALDEYSRAIDSDPENAEAYNNRGNLQEELGHHEQALLDLNHAIAIDPKYAKAFNNRGVTLDSLGRTEDAVKAFSQAIETAENYAQAYNNRGAVFYKLKQYYLAIQDFTRAIELQPGVAQIYLNRGNAARDWGGVSEAILDYDLAIQLRPDFADAYGNRAVACYQLQQFEQASRDLNTAIKLGFPANPQFVELLHKASAAAAR